MRFEKNEPAPKPIPEEFKGFQAPPGYEPEIVGETKREALDKRNILQTRLGTETEILSLVDKDPLKALKLYDELQNPDNLEWEIPPEVYMKMWRALAKENPKEALFRSISDCHIEATELTPVAKTLAIRDPKSFLQMPIYDVNDGGDVSPEDGDTITVNNYKSLEQIAWDQLKQKDPETYKEYMEHGIQDKVW